MKLGEREEAQCPVPIVPECSIHMRWSRGLRQCHHEEVLPFHGLRALGLSLCHWSCLNTFHLVSLARLQHPSEEGGGQKPATLSGHCICSLGSGCVT